MTTRCTVLITNENDTRFYFYRHADGYPAITGADVLAAAQAAVAAVDRHQARPDLSAINYLLAQSRPDRYNPTAPLYRLVAATPPDIEHFYHIDCSDHYVFIAYATGDGTDGHRLEADTEPLALCQFRHLINAQRADFNGTLAALAAHDPYYSQHEPFPLLP